MFEDIHLPERPLLEKALGILNYFFAAVFSLEFLLKVIGLGVVKYFSSVWNCLDAFIVAVSNWITGEICLSYHWSVTRKQLSRSKSLCAFRPYREYIKINSFSVQVTGSYLFHYFLRSRLLACLITNNCQYFDLFGRYEPCDLSVPYPGWREWRYGKLSVMHFFWLGRLICLEEAHYIVASSAIADDIAEEYSTGWIKNYKNEDQRSSSKRWTPILQFADICAHSEFRPGKRFLNIDWKFYAMWHLLIVDGDSDVMGSRLNKTL